MYITLVGNEIREGGPMQFVIVVVVGGGFLFTLFFVSCGNETLLYISPVGNGRKEGGPMKFVIVVASVFFVFFVFESVLVVTRPYCTLHQWASDGGREVHGSLTETVGGAALPLTKIFKIH